MLQLKDEFYNRYVRDKRVIDRVVQCFKDNGPRYNLLNSALIEFFEFIRTVRDALRILLGASLSLFRLRRVGKGRRPKAYGKWPSPV